MVKNPPANARVASSIPELGRSPGKGNGNPAQYSCLGNPTDRGAWGGYRPWAAKELDATERINSSTYCGLLLNRCSALAVGTEGAQAVRSCGQGRVSGR